MLCFFLLLDGPFNNNTRRRETNRKFYMEPKGWKVYSFVNVWNKIKMKKKMQVYFETKHY